MHMSFCDKCGSGLTAGATDCPECGNDTRVTPPASLHNFPKPVQPPPEMIIVREEQGLNPWRILGWGCLIFIAVAVVGCLSFCAVVAQR
jgi:uncharacterized membrane protein YvbJ